MPHERDPDLMDAIGLAEASRMLRGRGGRPPSLATMRRWANPKRGYRPRGYTGQAIVLRTIRLGNDLITFREWVEEFARLQLGMTGRGLDPPPRTTRSRQAAQRQAARELERMGLEAG